MRYGYVRVSTREQNIDRQFSALVENKLAKENIFIDYVSGKDFDRIEYQKLLTTLKENDELVIKSIDRLGRNYDEILEQWQSITKKKKVNITVLDFPLLNTKNSDDNITGKKKGKKFGRPKLLAPDNLPDVIAQYTKKEITLREGADILGVSKSTFHNWIKNS